VRHIKGKRLEQAVHYLEAGGRPEGIASWQVRTQAWQAAGRVLYLQAGDWLIPWQADTQAAGISRRIFGVPVQRIMRGQDLPMHPLKIYNGPIEGVPKNQLPCSGRKQTIVTTSGEVLRVMSWAGNFATAAEETGMQSLARIAQVMASELASEVRNA
jgi:hypothetical protein